MSRTSIHLSIAATACVIACGAVGFLLWRVNVEGVTLITALKSEQEGVAKADAYRDAQLLLQSTEDDRMILNTYVLRGDEDAVALLSLIETTAEGLSVILTTEQLNEAASTNAEFTDLQLTLSLSGQNDRVLSMITMLETLPYQSRVNTVRFDRNRNPTSGVVEADAQVSLVVSMKK